MAKRKQSVPAFAALAEGFSLLREAILAGDWQKAAEAYEKMTGESVEVPAAPVPTFDRVAFVETLLMEVSRLAHEMAALPAQSASVPPAPPQVSAPILVEPVRTSSASLSTTQEENLFVDDGSVAPELIAESRTQKPKAKNYRDAFRMLDVVCSRCGKSEQIHPDLRPVRFDSSDEASSYVCNGCVGRRQ